MFFFKIFSSSIFGRGGFLGLGFGLGFVIFVSTLIVLTTFVLFFSTVFTFLLVTLSSVFYVKIALKISKTTNTSVNTAFKIFFIL